MKTKDKQKVYVSCKMIRQWYYKGLIDFPSDIDIVYTYKDKYVFKENEGCIGKIYSPTTKDMKQLNLGLRSWHYTRAKSIHFLVKLNNGERKIM